MTRLPAAPLAWDVSETEHKPLLQPLGEEGSPGGDSPNYLLLPRVISPWEQWSKAGGKYICQKNNSLLSEEIPPPPVSP